VENNFIGITGDVPIYRIVDLGYLLQDISQGTLTLPRVMSWDDTHEAAYYRSPIELGGIDTSIEDLGLEWFGQCWSLKPESDAMWRIYNANYESVRITALTGDLFDSVLRSRVAREPSFISCAHMNLFIGKVWYHDDPSYRISMKKSLREFVGLDQRTAAELLLQKRDAFEHENEVRLLYQSISGQEGLSDRPYYSGDLTKAWEFRHHVSHVPELISLPFDWTIVKEVMIGPRTKRHVAVGIRELIGLVAPWINVNESNLYGPPPRLGNSI
jgi:hypothetical protein